MAITTTGRVTAAIIVSLLFAGNAAGSCKHFSANEMRGIVSKKEIKLGMSEREVERSWGKPTKKRVDSTGPVWEYWNPVGDQIVRFSPDGCVVHWTTVRG